MQSDLMRLRAVVAADLRRLHDSWTADDVTDETVRLESAVLRRLLVDNSSGTLGRLRVLSRQPEPLVEALDLSRAYPKGAQVGSPVLMAHGGKLRLGGVDVVIGQMRISNQPLPLPRQLEPSQIRLSRLGDSICAIVNERRIKRRELIKYVTNKLGGVHYDDVRRPEEHATEIALDGLGHRPKSESELTISFGGTTEHSGLHLVYFELLSIGQAVVNSPGVRALAQLE